MVRQRLKRWLRHVRQGARRVRHGDGRDLYETRDGRRYWLDASLYLDGEIIHYGEFEADSTALVRALVRPGDVVADVGANIGYYTVLLSKLVGPSGRIIAFEPTEIYRELNQRNLAENDSANVELLPYGLSDARTTLEVSIAGGSATLHWAEPDAPPERESIELRTLDEVAAELDLQRLDFVKIDVDGHEPAFLEGAWETLDRLEPLVLLEIAHLNYLTAGVDALSFYQGLVKRGWHLYSEVSWTEYSDAKAFLVECGNFTHSANVLMSRRPLPDLADRRRRGLAGMFRRSRSASG